MNLLNETRIKEQLKYEMQQYIDTIKNTTTSDTTKYAMALKLDAYRSILSRLNIITEQQAEEAGEVINIHCLKTGN